MLRVIPDWSPRGFSWRDRMFGYEGYGWVAYFWFTDWSHISLGLHVCLRAPNIEFHLPFCFLRIGHRDDPVLVRKAEQKAAA